MQAIKIYLLTKSLLPLLQIVLYQMNGGKGCMARDKPPDLPEQGADAIYRYSSFELISTVTLSSSSCQPNFFVTLVPVMSHFPKSIGKSMSML